MATGDLDSLTLAINIALKQTMTDATLLAYAEAHARNKTNDAIKKRKTRDKDLAATRLCLYKMNLALLYSETFSADLLSPFLSSIGVQHRIHNATRKVADVSKGVFIFAILRNGRDFFVTIVDGVFDAHLMRSNHFLCEIFV